MNKYFVEIYKIGDKNGVCLYRQDKYGYWDHFYVGVYVKKHWETELSINPFDPPRNILLTFYE